MDGAAHRVAQRPIDELVALQRAQARELRGDHERREVHVVVRRDTDRRARERGLDMLGNLRRRHVLILVVPMHTGTLKRPVYDAAPHPEAARTR